MRCPKCNAEIEEDGAFCTECGAKIERKAPKKRTKTTKQEAEPSVKITLPFKYLIAVPIAVLIVGAIFVLVTQQDQTTPQQIAKEPCPHECCKDASGGKLDNGITVVPYEDKLCSAENQRCISTACYNMEDCVNECCEKPSDSVDSYTYLTKEKPCPSGGSCVDGKCVYDTKIENFDEAKEQLDKRTTLDWQQSAESFICDERSYTPSNAVAFMAKVDFENDLIMCEYPNFSVLKENVADSGMLNALETCDKSLIEIFKKAVYSYSSTTVLGGITPHFLETCDACKSVFLFYLACETPDRSSFVVGAYYVDADTGNVYQ